MNNNKTEINPAQAGVSGEPNDLAQAPPAQENNGTPPASAGGCLPRPCSANSELTETAIGSDGKSDWLKGYRKKPILVSEPETHAISESPPSQ